MSGEKSSDNGSTCGEVQRVELTGTGGCGPSPPDHEKGNGQEMASVIETPDRGTSPTKCPNDSMCSVQDESVVEEPANDATQKARRRTKGLQRKLQSQIEFYFSDSNLTKDRFLKQKIAEHNEGYVSVDVVSSFNKMKSLSTDRSVILQSIKRSSLVELSPDELWVRRTTPLPSLSEQEIDSRTVYVENLSPKTNHDKLKRLFSHFGLVTYVSLPRHKNSSSIKGFAFIEFSSADGAKKAIEHFKPKEPPALETEVLPSTDSQQQSSTVEESAQTAEDSVFVDPAKQPPPSGSSSAELSTGASASGVEVPNVCGNLEKTSGKRPREEEEEETPEKTTLSPDAKRKKTESNEEQRSESMPSGETEENRDIAPRKRTHQDSESNEFNDSLSKTPRLDSTWSELSAIEDGDDEESKKKKKTRTHRKRKDSIPQKLKNLNLRVISKSEWLEMKLMYKQMQKEHMKSVKAENRAAENAGQGTRCLVTKCLVKVTCTINEGVNPVTIEILRDFCSKYGPVAYVDYEAGSETGYIRYGESGCAQKLADTEDNLPGVKFEAVPEEEERGYFLKTKAARRQKFINKKSQRQTRGLDKVISRAIKRTEKPHKASSQAIHIRFSDSEGED